MKLRVGTKMLSIREDRRLSQADLADILGIPLSTYSRIERNESSIELEKLVGFADKLNIPIQELLPETLSITNNHHSSGQGGGVIFGNLYFNFYGSDEIARLKEKIADLESRLEKGGSEPNS